MIFLAEIKEIKQTKSASLDNVYSIRLVTDNKEIMKLSDIPPDSLVVVEINKEG